MHCLLLLPRLRHSRPSRPRRAGEFDSGAELDVCRAEMDVLSADAIRELYDRAPDKPVMLAEVGAVLANHAGPSDRYPGDTRGELLHDERHERRHSRLPA